MQLIVRCTQFKRCLNVIKYVLESFVIQHHCDHTNRKICIGSNLLKFLERSISQLNCRDKMYHQEFFNFHWLSLALVLQDCLTTPATKVILVLCLNSNCFPPSSAQHPSVYSGLHPIVATETLSCSVQHSVLHSLTLNIYPLKLSVIILCLTLSSNNI